MNAVFNQADPSDTKTMQVKLAVRLDTVKEVFEVDFTVVDNLCPQCDDDKDKDQWNCAVQVQRI